MDGFKGMLAKAAAMTGAGSFATLLVRLLREGEGDKVLDTAIGAAVMFLVILAIASVVAIGRRRLPGPRA